MASSKILARIGKNVADGDLNKGQATPIHVKSKPASALLILDSSKEEKG